MLVTDTFRCDLPSQLFYTTQIPVCLWFLAKNKNADAKRGFRDRLGLENQLALAARKHPPLNPHQWAAKKHK